MSRRPGKARTTLLWAAGWFALGQLSLILLLTVWMPELRDPNYSYKADRLKQRLMAAPARPLTVVMLGSSRTVCGFQGRSLEAPLTRALGRPVVVFNFGLNAAGPVNELVTLRRLLADGIRPSLLLVEVLPPLLAGQVPLFEATPLRLPATRLRADDLPLVARCTRPARREVRRDWRRTWLLPCYHYRFALVSRVFPSLLRLSERLDGFRGINDSGDLQYKHIAAQRPQALANAEREYRMYLNGFRLGGAAPLALEEILKTCRQEGIPAALVLMPEGPAFRSWYRGQSWPRIQAYLEGLRHCHGVPLVCAREWLEEDDFVDSHHMMSRGAVAFTRRLGQAIQPLIPRPRGDGARIRGLTPSARPGVACGPE